jgi:hypothetical protein
MPFENYFVPKIGHIGHTIIQQHQFQQKKKILD